MTDSKARRLKIISSPPPESVGVDCPARLHLGFLDLNGGLGRRFGGIGLAIDGFATRLTIRTSAQMRVEGAESERILTYVTTINRHLGLNGAYHLHIENTAPAHAGLGSGTAIALAVAAGVRTLHRFDLAPQEDAAALGRGARSGLGIAAFAGGGLVVDGSRGSSTLVPPVVARAYFPDAWRALLVLDAGRQGLHGRAESTAFADLPPFPAEIAAHLCHRVLMQGLPAVAEIDFAGFGAAVTEIQKHLGDYYAPLQGGGRFTSAAVGDVLKKLERNGAAGIGQSSWGPTGFAFAPSEREADRLAHLVRGDCVAQGLDILVCRGLNRGAEITTQPSNQAAKSPQSAAGE